MSAWMRGILQAGAIQFGANGIHVGLLGELNVHDGAAAEIDAERNVMPEQHGSDAGEGEDQRESEKVPLLAKEVDICATKQFHCKSLLPEKRGLL